jgi:hypothetical protein
MISWLLIVSVGWAFVDEIHFFYFDVGSSFLVDVDVVVGDVFESDFGHSLLF